MDIKIWIFIFAIIWMFNFLLFGMQRGTLLISRNAGIEWKGGGELLLPKWYPITWIFIISKWGFLLAMAYYADWKYALGLAIISFFLTMIVPIPYRLYKGIYRQNVTSIMQKDPILGIRLKIMLDGAPF